MKDWHVPDEIIYSLESVEQVLRKNKPSRNDVRIYAAGLVNKAIRVLTGSDPYPPND